MPRDPLVEAMMADAYRLQQEAGVFDPNNPRNQVAETPGLWQVDRDVLPENVVRNIERAKAGVFQGLTLGFSDAWNRADEANNPEGFDPSDVSNFAGNFIGSFPAALAGGKAAASLASWAAPGLLAVPGLSFAGRALGYAAGEAPEGTSLLGRVAHGAASNLLQGTLGFAAPVEALHAGARALGLEQGGIDPGRIGKNLLIGAGVDALVGGALSPFHGSRPIEGGTKGDAYVDVVDGGDSPHPATLPGDDTQGLVDITDVAAQRAAEQEAEAAVRSQGAVMNPLAMEEAPPEWLQQADDASYMRALPPGQPGTPPGAIPMGGVQETGYPRRFADGSLGMNPRPVGAPGPGVLDAEILGFEPPEAARAMLPAQAGGPRLTPPPAGSVLDPNRIDRLARGGINTVRRSMPPPAPVAPVPVDPEAAALAMPRQKSVLAPEELALVAPELMGAGDPSMNPLGMAPEAAPPSVPEPTVPEAALLVDPREVRSQAAQAVAYEANSAYAAGDKRALFAVVANLSDPSLKLPPGERDLLAHRLMEALQQMPDPARPPRPLEEPANPSQPLPSEPVAPAGERAAVAPEAAGGAASAPPAQRHPIRAAAVRHRESGRIFEGRVHPDAEEAAAEAGLISEDDIGDSDLGLFDEGFTDTNGRFLTRAEVGGRFGSGEAESLRDAGLVQHGGAAREAGYSQAERDAQDTISRLESRVDDGVATDEEQAAYDTARSLLETRAAPAGDAPQGGRIPGADGREYNVRFSDGKPLKARYRVVELDDLKPSHRGEDFQKNPDYPEGVQGREYERDRAAQEAVAGQTANFDPELPLSATPAPNVGPSGIRPDGTVIWGHGRAMILDRVRSGKPEAYGEYRQALQDRAAAYGVNPAEIEGMRHPVLVSEVVDPAVDLSSRDALRDLNTRSDVDVGKRKDALSDAATRARAFRQSEALEHFGRTVDPESTFRDYAGTPAGKQFAEELVRGGVIQRSESHLYVDRETGTLNEAGRDLVDNMMMVAAIGDTKVVAAMPKSLRQQLEHAIPAVVKTASIDGWDVTPALRGAVKLHAEQRAAGVNSIDSMLNDQGSLLTREDDPQAVRLGLFLEHANKAQTAEAFRGYAADAERAAHADAHDDLFGFQAPDPDVTFAQWFGDDGGFGTAVERSRYLDALKAKVSPKGSGLNEMLRREMRRALKLPEGMKVADEQLVKEYSSRGFVDDASFRATQRVIDEWGYYQPAANLLFDPLIGGTVGGVLGGAAGARADRDDPERGFLIGGALGFAAGAVAVSAAGHMMLRVPERIPVNPTPERMAVLMAEETAAARRAAAFLRVSGDDPRLGTTPPSARPPRVGEPLQGVQGRRGAWSPGTAAPPEIKEGDLHTLMAPRIEVGDRPRQLGIIETWLDNPTDLFRRYDEHAGKVAEEGARAIDSRNNFLDLRKTQVASIMKELTKGVPRAQAKELKAELWRTLDKHPLVSDVPMSVRQNVKGAFLSMRALFRDDVLRLYNMKRSLLKPADVATIDEALDQGLREATLPETFPEHLRPLVAMKTGEWGIAAYWPHVFDGSWHVEAGPHSGWFNTRNEAEAYAKELHAGGKWTEDVAVNHTLRVSSDMAQMLPRDRYWRLVDELRGALGLQTGSIVRATGDVVRPGPGRRFLAHEAGRKVDLQTFVQDPEQALDLYYHRWATKLAFDPFRVKSADLMSRVDGKVGGLKEELEDYVRRVQGMPSRNEQAMDASLQKAFLWLSGGRVETKPFVTRRTSARINAWTAFAKLGYSPASVAVNLTQTAVNTAPYLGEKWVIRGVEEAMQFNAARMRGQSTPQVAEIEAVLRQSGAMTMHPQHLVGDAEALLAGGPMTPMYLFDKAEKVNRSVAAIAAYRKARVEMGLEYEPAIDYVRETLRKTQFRYDISDTPKIAANPVGKTLFQFQTYALKELRFMAELARRNPKAALKSLAYTAALTGARGLLVSTPIAALDILAGHLGLTKTEDGLKLRPSEALAQEAPDWLTFGMFGALLQSDFTQRLGFGTPGEFSGGGPNVETVKTLLDARQAYAEGNTEHAGALFRRTLPLFMGRLYNAWQIHDTGEMRDSWGRTVAPATMGDQLRAAVGLRGIEDTRTFDRETIRRRVEERSAGIATLARSRIFEALDAGDPEAVQRAVQAASDQGVHLSPSDVRQGYIQLRHPEIRAIRRTRKENRGPLFNSKILRPPP